MLLTLVFLAYSPYILLSALLFLLLSAASPNRTCTYPSSSSFRTPASSFSPSLSSCSPLYYYNSRPALSENRLSVVQRAHPGLQSSSLRVGVGFFAFSEFCIRVELAGRSLFVCLRCISSVLWRDTAITRIVSCLTAYTHQQKPSWWLRSVCCVGRVPVWACWVANSLVCGGVGPSTGWQKNFRPPKLRLRWCIPTFQRTVEHDSDASQRPIGWHLMQYFESSATGTREPITHTGVPRRGW